MGGKLGGRWDTHVRFDRVLTPGTRIRVLTEGILNRQLIDDPFLEGVGAVIRDEFHERGIHTDMAISLLREVRENVRPDLIIMVMSARRAGGGAGIAEFLGGCPIIRSAGRLFDVAVEYRGRVGWGLKIRRRAEVRGLFARPWNETGDVLVFLAGGGGNSRDAKAAWRERGIGAAAAWKSAV